MNGIREARQNEKFCSGGKVKKIVKWLKVFLEKNSQSHLKKINLKGHLKVTTTGFTTNCKTDF